MAKLKSPDPGEVADARKRAGAIEEGAVSGDKWAVQLYGEGQEGGIVEGEAELTELSTTIFAAISAVPVIADNVGRVPLAYPMLLEFTEGS